MIFYFLLNQGFLQPPLRPPPPKQRIQRGVPQDNVFTDAFPRPCPASAHHCICCCLGLHIFQCPVSLPLPSHQSHLSAHHNPISMRAKTSPALQNHFSASLSPASMPVSAFICTAIGTLKTHKQGHKGIYTPACRNLRFDYYFF